MEAKLGHRVESTDPKSDVKNTQTRCFQEGMMLEE